MERNVSKHNPLSRKVPKGGTAWLVTQVATTAADAGTAEEQMWKMVVDFPVPGGPWITSNAFCMLGEKDNIMWYDMRTWKMQAFGFC